MDAHEAVTEHVSVYVISALWKISLDRDSLCSSNGQVGAIDVEHNVYFFNEAMDEVLCNDKLCSLFEEFQVFLKRSNSIFGQAFPHAIATD